MVEAIGIPLGWTMCQELVRCGGHIAMLGVHGKPTTINLETMWYKNAVRNRFLSQLKIPS